MRDTGLGIILVVTVLISVMSFGAAAPLQPPASYYGTAQIGGNDVESGTTIEAIVNGQVGGSITLEEDGQYGAEGTSALEVECDSCEGGEKVTFRINELNATQTATWESGAVVEKNLTFVDDVPPDVNFRMSPDPANPGESIDFDAGSASDNYKIESYEWDLGDGNTATGEWLTHSYDDTGTYTVTLTVTDKSGNSATKKRDVTVGKEDTTTTTTTTEEEDTGGGDDTTTTTTTTEEGDTGGGDDTTTTTTTTESTTTTTTPSTTESTTQTSITTTTESTMTTTGSPNTSTTNTTTTKTTADTKTTSTTESTTITTTGGGTTTTTESSGPPLFSLIPASAAIIVGLAIVARRYI